MVPLGTLADGPRFQRAADDHPLQQRTPPPPINGAWAPGISSGQAVQTMDKLAAEELLDRR